MGKDHELLEAARIGNLSVVEKLIFSRSKSSSFAASFGIRVGANINCQDQNGYTPLHHASLNGHCSIVQSLLEAGASVKVSDNKGSCPLHLAAWNGKSDIVKLLLTTGPSLPSVNKQNGDKETALHCAAQHGHLDSVKTLLDNHADAQIRNIRDESALDLASQYGRLDVVRLLLTYYPKLLAHSPERFTSLHLASRNGHRGVVELLLVHGADINKVGANGTALHEAALFGKYDVVSLLLKRGAETGSKDSSERTALELVSQLDTHISRDIAKLIVARIQDGEDYEPLRSIISSKSQQKVPGARVSQNLSQSFGEADLASKDPTRGRPLLTTPFRNSRVLQPSPDTSRSPSRHRLKHSFLRRTSSTRSARSLPRMSSSASFHGIRSLHNLSIHRKKSRDMLSIQDWSIRQHHPSIDMFPVTTTRPSQTGHRTSVSEPSSPQLGAAFVSNDSPELHIRETKFRFDGDSGTPTSGRPSFETFLLPRHEPRAVIPLKPTAGDNTSASPPQKSSTNISIIVKQPKMEDKLSPFENELSAISQIEISPPLPEKPSSLPPCGIDLHSPPMLTENIPLFPVRPSNINPSSTNKGNSNEIASCASSGQGHQSERSSSMSFEGHQEPIVPNSRLSSSSDISPNAKSPGGPRKSQRHKPVLMPPPLPPKPAHMTQETKKTRPPPPVNPPPTDDDDIFDEYDIMSDDEVKSLEGATNRSGVSKTSESTPLVKSLEGATDRDTYVAAASKEQDPNDNILTSSKIFTSSDARKDIGITSSEMQNKPNPAPSQTLGGDKEHQKPMSVPQEDLETQPQNKGGTDLLPRFAYRALDGTKETQSLNHQERSRSLAVVQEHAHTVLPDDPTSTKPASETSENPLSPTLRSPSPPFSPPSPNTAMLQVSSTLQKAMPLMKSSTNKPMHSSLQTMTPQTITPELPIGVPETRKPHTKALTEQNRQKPGIPKKKPSIRQHLTTKDAPNAKSTSKSTPVASKHPPALDISHKDTAKNFVKKPTKVDPNPLPSCTISLDTSHKDIAKNSVKNLTKVHPNPSPGCTVSLDSSHKDIAKNSVKKPTKIPPNPSSSCTASANRNFNIVPAKTRKLSHNLDIYEGDAGTSNTVTTSPHKTSFKCSPQDQKTVLRPQSGLHYTSTEIKRARICSTRSVTEISALPTSYGEYDSLCAATEGLSRSKRSSSLGPQVAAPFLSKPMEVQTVATVRKVSDAYTQTNPPKVSQRRRLLPKSKSVDRVINEPKKMASSPIASKGITSPKHPTESPMRQPNSSPKPVPRIKPALVTTPPMSPQARRLQRPKKPVKPTHLSLNNKAGSKDVKDVEKKTVSMMQERVYSPVKAPIYKGPPSQETSEETSLTAGSKDVDVKKNTVSMKQGRIDSPVKAPANKGSPSQETAEEMTLADKSVISLLTLDTSGDWSDALSDRTEDLGLPNTVRKYRGLIRGSSLSYRSRFTSCSGARDTSYDSDEFEYNYRIDKKTAYSRVNASLQPDDEIDVPRYNSVVTKGTGNSVGGFYPAQTRLSRNSNQQDHPELMEVEFTQILGKKPSSHHTGEPKGKHRKEEKPGLLFNKALTVTSQQGFVDPTPSRDSSYDNNNNNTSEDNREPVLKRSTSPLKTTKMAAVPPTVPSPMSDGLPDFGTIVDTVTAVRNKVSPQGSTSGVSSSSSSQSSTLAKQDPLSPSNENDEWAQIANVMKSVGSSLNKDPVYAQEFEETFWRIMTGSSLPRRVGTWLSDLNLSQYEDVLCGNGFDNVNFLASDILEEQDLIDMNITNESHRSRMLDSAKNLPKIRPLNSSDETSRTAPSSVGRWLRSLGLKEHEETLNKMGLTTLAEVMKMKDTEILGIIPLRGHKKRIRASLGLLHSGQSAMKTRSMSLGSPRPIYKLKSSPPLPRSPLLDTVNFFKDYSKDVTVKSTTNASLNVYGTTSSSSSALTNYSSLSDQVIPVSISEKPELHPSRKSTRYTRSKSESIELQNQTRRSEKKSDFSNPPPYNSSSLDSRDQKTEKLNNFLDITNSNQEDDLLTLAINCLTDGSVKKSETTQDQESKENLTMSSSESHGIRVPDARRASYLSNHGELVLRPPNEATEEGVTVSSWCHDPEVLIKSCCNYQAYYLGSMLVHDVKGVESTVEACTKMKKSTDSMKKIPTVTLSISYRGVKFIDSKSKHEIAEHEIHNISFASQDADDLSTLAYITRDARTDHHYCHVFRVTALEIAYEIILTLGQAFEVAYQLILKEKALQEGSA